MTDETDIRAAVHNLLHNGAGLKPGAGIVIVSEPEGAGYYGAGLVASVRHAAEALGHPVGVHERAFDPDLAAPDRETARIMAGADLTLFLARMGDQIRFRPGAARAPVAICYALDPEMLASAYGRIDHRAMVRLRDITDGALRSARRIRITCPAGTDLSGAIGTSDRTGDTPALRFPLSVHTPISCAGFSGTIAQRGFLVGTGSRFYDPYMLAIEGTLRVTVENGRITRLDGPSSRAARDHYARIGRRYQIDPWIIHSWHGGIHPACSYADAASDNFERWSGGAFGNPRLLHFHTCGNYAPGEICLNLLDPTVEIDSVPIRRNGRLIVDALPGGTALIEAAGDLAAALADPAPDCGASPDSGLSAQPNGSA